MLKDLAKGTPVELTGLKKEEHKTQPPPRFSETKLISQLEADGIGRPATFSSMVSLIQERGYVVKIKNQLVPTFLGFTAVSLLRDAFPKFTALSYTSELEEELDEIAAGNTSRAKFLDSFWNGPNGFEKTITNVKANVDWARVRELSTLNLGNGYGVVFNKFGAWLENLEAERGENGQRPSVKLAEDDTVESFDLTDPAVCRELFEKIGNRGEDRVLGELTTGVHAGWTVTAKDGRYGEFLQATPPESDKKSKPVNHKMPEGDTVESVTLDQAVPLFEEVKLPRTLSDQFFVGIGKRGNWIGRKANARARRAVFIGMPEEFDPRTVTLAEVEKIWQEKEEAKKNKPAAKKAPAKKTAAKKVAPKKQLVHAC